MTTRCTRIHDTNELDTDPSQAGGYGTNRTGPYLPSWQASPVIPDAESAVYNLDLFGAHLHKSAIQALQDTHQVSIMEAYMIPDYSDSEQLAETEVRGTLEVNKKTALLLTLTIFSFICSSLATLCILWYRHMPIGSPTILIQMQIRWNP
jgi:hypothetical protein